MTDPGVVDPIRIPAWIREPAERWWRDLPTVARVFLVLAVVDVLARAIGIIGPRMSFGDDLLQDVRSVLPHDLWILLPALIVARRPDAATATQAIFLAAILLALIELLASPLFGLIGATSADAIGISSLWSMLHTGAVIFGWVLLARGLAALNPRAPSPPVAGLSNLVALCVAGQLITDLIGLAIGPTFALGDAGLTMLANLSSVLGAFQLVGWGYLLWIVVRGLGDSRRPTEATVTAVIGACLAAAFGLALGIIALISIATQRPFDVLFGANGQSLANALSWVAESLGPSLILGAFALGLGEPPIPLAATSSDAGPSTDPGPVKAPSRT